jgi:flagellar basal-body rod modification protein FlgD
MTDSTAMTPQLSKLESSLTQTAATGKKKKNDEIGKNEFLSLLVTQLKNQDPLDPMKSEEFAVNLAQFSQLEQLVSINDTLTAGSTDTASLAGFLGQEVFLDSTKVKVDGGQGGSLKFNLAQDSEVTVELLRRDGSVAERVNVGQLGAGERTVDLAGLTSPSGEYGFRVTAQGASGPAAVVPTKVGGVVTGFMPGPTPMLMVGSREIAPADVVEVRVPRAG